MAAPPPKKRATRATRATPKKDWPEKFLKALTTSLGVSGAAKSAGIDRATAYRRRHADPAFAAAWDDALQQCVDNLEQVAADRARSGSDVLLIFLLKAHRPKIYRETTRAENINLDVSALTDDQVDRLAKGEDVASILATPRAGGTGAPEAGEEPPAGPSNLDA